MLQNCFSTIKRIKKYYATSRIIKKTKYIQTHYQVITPLLHNVGKTVRSPTASYQRRYKMVPDASLLSAQHIRTGLASLLSNLVQKKRDGYHPE